MDEDVRCWASMEASKLNALLGLDRSDFKDILVTLFDYIHVNGEPRDKNLRQVHRGLECIRCGVWMPTTVANVVRVTCNKFLNDVLPLDGSLRSACQSHIDEAEHLLDLYSNDQVFEELGERICQALAAGPRPGTILPIADSPPSEDTVPEFMCEDLTDIYDFPGQLDRTRLVKLIKRVFVSNPANRSIRWDPVANRFSCLGGGQGEGLPGCSSVDEDLECLLGQVSCYIDIIKEAAVAKLQRTNASQVKLNTIESSAELLSSYVDVCINEIGSGQHNPAMEVEPAIIAIKKVLLKNGQPGSDRVLRSSRA